MQRSTGLVIDPYFSGTKIRWLLDHVPGAHVAAAQGELAFGTIDSWLLWKLTGGHVHATDVSNASRTMLFDIRHNVWDHELLKALHVPDSLLPQVFPSSHVFGETDPALFGAPIPIAGIAGDQQSALFGQACFKRRAGEEHLWHRLLPADAHRRALRDERQRPDHHGSRATHAPHPSTRSKAASSSAARWCSGCATA